MQAPIKQTALLLLFLFIASSAMAKDTLESILSVAAKQQHVAIDYHEIRHLQLLNEPWQAEGQMFVTPDDFVINQRSPERQLLASSKHRFWIFMPDKNIRRSGMLTSPMARKSFALFIPIMRGDRKTLDKKFEINFSAIDDQWQIDLKPKVANRASYKRILVKGENGHPANYMKTEMGDGDYSEWFFQQQKFNLATENMVNNLMDEARGL